MLSITTMGSSEVIAAIIGGVIGIVGIIVGAVITGFIAHWLSKGQEKRSWNSRRKLFASAILVDMEQSIALYEKIINDWKKTSTVWYEDTAELKEYRIIYEKYMEHILQFSPEIMERIIKYYAKTKYLILNLESSQRRKYELFKVYQTILKSLKQSQPGISDENANKLASELAKDEDMEFAAINKGIENNITKLVEFKNEASSILDKLRKEI